MSETNDKQMLPIGTLLKQGEYRVVRYIASGGFGNTYEVVHTRLPKRFAVKEFFMRGVNQREGIRVTVSNEDNRDSFNQIREKFYKEAQRLAMLEEPHIVEVTDFFEDNQTAYYVMKLIDGESLAATLKRTGKPFSESEVRSILSQVLQALQAVHAQGLYHLDLKPNNIMRNSQGHCWLIDFGASKQLSAQESMTLSTSTGLSYTPGYAPGEQLSGNMSRIGAWTDFYALGATLYNLLSNQAPPDIDDVRYDGENAFHFPSDVSQDMRQLVLWLMQPDYPRRPQQVEEITARLATMAQPEPTSQATIPIEKNGPEEIPGQPIEETLNDTSDETIPASFEETIPASFEETIPASSEETVIAVQEKKDSFGIVLSGIILGAAFILAILLPLFFFNKEKKDIPAELAPNVNDKFDISSRTYSFCEGLARVVDNGKWGFIDKMGTLVIPYKWKYVDNFSEGLASVKDSNDKWGFIDKTGTLVIPCKWKWTRICREGLVSVKDFDGKWSYLDKTGNQVISCKWDDVRPFKDGLAEVQDSNGKWGFIDKTGRLVIPCKWDIVFPFLYDGVSIVVDSIGNSYYIDKSGRIMKKL